MLDYVACILVRALNLIFYLVPLSASLWFGRRLGTLVFMINRKRRLIAYANLKAAFGREKSPQELRRLTKRVYQNLIQTFVEILNLTKVDKRYVEKYVHIPRVELIQNASKSGRGTILLTGHFGDWELSSLTSALIGFPILVLAREQKMKRLNELLNKLRESKGCKVIRKGISTKHIVRALHDNDIVGILSDQDAGKNGIFVDFFGRPTSTHAGPAEIAKRTDSLILPNFIARVKGPYHKVFLEEYIDFRELKGEDDVRQCLQKFANVLESYIRKYPDQWLWLHKRWKSTPVRTILVLSDAKAGHLNQSLAVARQIQQVRLAQGYAPEDTKITVCEVKYKSPFARTALTAFANAASWRCHGCMRCMKACLAPHTYETLMKTYSEFVISCGSALAGVNVFMAKENNAKSIIIMKPDMVGMGKFDLALIPWHDRPAKRKNITTTTVAPNLIDQETLRIHGEKLRVHIGTLQGPFVSVLIGGENPEFTMTKDMADGMIDGLLAFSRAYRVKFLVTTSRRTPKQVEHLLKERLKTNEACAILIIANEQNLDEAVGGMLGLSDLVVVSGESISMVSEAISSGKRTVAFELKKKSAGPVKHERALRELARQGYITVTGIDDLAHALERAWNDKRPVKAPKDNEKIYHAVARLI